MVQNSGNDSRMYVTVLGISLFLKDSFSLLCYVEQIEGTPVGNAIPEEKAKFLSCGKTDAAKEGRRAIHYALSNRYDRLSNWLNAKNIYAFLFLGHSPLLCANAKLEQRLQSNDTFRKLIECSKNNLISNRCGFMRLSPSFCWMQDIRGLTDFQAAGTRTLTSFSNRFPKFILAISVS